MDPSLPATNAGQVTGCVTRLRLTTYNSAASAKLQFGREHIAVRWRGSADWPCLVAPAE